MKKKSSNKKTKKYTVGGKVNTYIEDPSDMLAENDIMLAQAALEASNDPLVKGLELFATVLGTAGSSFPVPGGSASGKSKSTTPKTTAKYGGRVPVEVEGGEVAETPSGNLINFKGPKHKDGGIDTSLPPGTEIFSEKIKIEGKSLADRKKERENREKRYSKQADKGDSLGKNTLERVQKANAIRENLDKRIQDIFAVLEKQESSQSKQKFENGTGDGGVGSISKLNPLEMLKDIFGELKPLAPLEKAKNSNFFSNKISSLNPSEMLESIFGSPTAPLENVGDTKLTSDHPAMSTYGDLEKNKRGFNMDSLPFSVGDLAGIAGNLYQSIAPYQNTLRSRAEDSPNINAYRGFGEDALKANEEAKGYAQGMLDNMLQDIELSSTASKKSLRNSSTGVNTTRAMDIATEGNKTRAQREAYNQFAQMIMANLQQKAQLENIQDEVVMQGEAAKDIANRQDKAAFRTNIGQDKVNIGKGITEVGKFLNKSKERDVMENLLNSMYQHTGIDSMTGYLEGKGGKPLQDMVKDGSWKQATNNPNTKDGRYRTLQEFKTVNGIK